jgi:hypothetical protein
MILTIRLTPREAKALRIMCHRFQFGDAQNFLRDAPNVKADWLCEAVSRVRTALDGTGE